MKINVHKNSYRYFLMIPDAKIFDEVVKNPTQKHIR
jgi:hypothetical protein